MKNFIKFSLDEKFSENFIECFKQNFMTFTPVIWLTAGTVWNHRYAIPPLLNSANWNHTATSSLINTILVWRMANAGHSANCHGVDLPCCYDWPLLM